MTDEQTPKETAETAAQSAAADPDATASMVEKEAERAVSSAHPALSDDDVKRISKEVAKETVSGMVERFEVEAPEQSPPTPGAQPPSGEAPNPDGSQSAADTTAPRKRSWRERFEGVS